MAMDDRWILSRRQVLKSMAAAGVIAAADLAWWEEPLLRPRRAWGSAPVRFQFSVPEPKRNALVESLVQRFNQSQKDFEVKVEFVPQAQARQKLITSITAGSPPDCCQVWDNWVGEFDGMGAIEDLTGKVKDWKYYSDVLPIAWQTVTVKNRIASFPWVVTNDAVYYRTDRLKEYGLKAPKDDWTFDDFLTLTKGFTKTDKNQYGFGMRGQGTWAVLYATEFMYANGAQVLKDGKVAINSKEAADALDWYLDLFRKYKVCPPSRSDGRLARHRRGLRPRRHQHVHPQLRLRRGAEGIRGREELRHRAAPDRAGQEARLVLLLGDAHGVQQGEEPRGGMAVHELAHGGRAEPHVHEGPRSPAVAQEPVRAAGISERSRPTRAS